MTEQPQTSEVADPYASVPQLMRGVIQKVQTLDANLTRAVRALERRGIQLTFDVSEDLLNIRHDLARAQHEAGRLNNQLTRLQHLVRSSALMTSSLQLEQVLIQVLDSVIALTEAERAYLMLRDKHTGELSICITHNCQPDHDSDPENVFSRSVIIAAIDRAEPIVTTNAQNDARFQSADSVVTQGLRSILCIPLVMDDELIGVLYADSRVRPGIFGDDILPSLATFGLQAAIAIEKARLHEEELQKLRMEEELNVGRQIQLSLLPKAPPDVPGWDFAAAYQAARVVGGDFYDFFNLPSGQVGVVVADVADKGVPAAIFMALSRTMLRSTAFVERGPAAALAQANALILQDNQSELFISAFYAVIDTASGKVAYANAGHNYPLLVRASGDVETLRASGIVLGTFADVQLQERETALEPGDMLIFYTDGITEAMNPDNEEFGEARLVAAALAQRDQSSANIVAAILGAVETFIGDAPQSDDLTLVVVKR
jgi:serine phosphatase RsbU (regulator of sigma subunit)